MSPPKEITGREVMLESVTYGKSGIETIKEYIDGEGKSLLESASLEQDRLGTYFGVLIAIGGINAFLHDAMKERISAKRDAYRLEGRSLAAERTRLQALEKERKRFDELVNHWYPSDEMECGYIHHQAIGNNEMLSLTSHALANLELFRNAGNANAPAEQLPSAERAPGRPLAEEAPQTLLTTSNEGLEDDAPGFQECVFTFAAPTKNYFAPEPTGEHGARTGKPSATSLLAFHPRYKGDYTSEEWEKRLLKVARCSSIGEMLRLFIGTEMLPERTPMQTSQLDHMLRERLLLTSTKAPPLWSCSFMLPMTLGSRYMFSKEVWGNPQDRYVTQSKAYERKQKSKQVAFFRAAMTLYPDETAHYCTLQRSDLNVAKEANESPFNFTDSSSPFTEQLTAAFADAASMEVLWTLEQTFPSFGAALPERYVVTAICRGDRYTYDSEDSVISAFVGAFMELENENRCGNNTVAMWTEFALLKPPATDTGQEVTKYLFDHFFGVPYGRESALEVAYTRDGNMWRATVTLWYSSEPSNSITIATATALFERDAVDLALRYAAARNFPEIFEQIVQTDPSKVSPVTMAYAKDIVKMLENGDVGYA